MARDGKTTTVGGSCVTYAGDYFGKKFGVEYAGQIPNSKAVTKLDGPKSGCCPVWTGGAAGYGHVGVVESWNSSTKKMDFSDSNYKEKDIVYRNTDITESTMKGYFGSTYKFAGYYEFN